MKLNREKIPQSDVLEWVEKNHPALHPNAEADREWLWLVVNLKGDEHKATRESMKQYGFVFSRRGGHLLPSGKLGMWGHSCELPLPFKRKSKQAPKSRGMRPTKTEEVNQAEDQDRVDPIAAAQLQQADSIDAEALAFALG